MGPAQATGLFPEPLAENHQALVATKATFCCPFIFQKMSISIDDQVVAKVKAKVLWLHLLDI